MICDEGCFLYVIRLRACSASKENFTPTATVVSTAYCFSCLWTYTHVPYASVPGNQQALATRHSDRDADGGDHIGGADCQNRAAASSQNQTHWSGGWLQGETTLHLVLICRRKAWWWCFKSSGLLLPLWGLKTKDLKCVLFVGFNIYVLFWGPKLNVVEFDLYFGLYSSFKLVLHLF